MDLESFDGPMDHIMKVNIKMTKNKVMENYLTKKEA